MEKEIVSVTGVLLKLDSEQARAVLGEEGYCVASGCRCPCPELEIYGRCKEKVYIAGGNQ